MVYALIVAVMNIAVAGATGFVGRRLLERLSSSGHEVRILTRNPKAESFQGSDAVINLAGEPVAQRWTPDVKRRIRSSRVDGTRHLVEALSTISKRPAVLINASAVGYYGDRGDTVLTEASEPGRGFLPETCVAWEQAARLAEALGIRVVLPRIGVVLDSGGGALARMVPLFRWGLGGPLGNGRHYMSWIHREDLVDLILYALDHPNLRGPVNATAPNPVTNAEFTRELGRALRRPAILPAPRFGLKLLFGEMAQMLFDSARVLPEAAQAAGFQFRFPTLAASLQAASTR